MSYLISWKVIGATALILVAVYPAAVLGGQYAAERDWWFTTTAGTDLGAEVFYNPCREHEGYCDNVIGPPDRKGFELHIQADPAALTWSIGASTANVYFQSLDAFPDGACQIGDFGFYKYTETFAEGLAPGDIIAWQAVLQEKGTAALRKVHGTVSVIDIGGFPGNLPGEWWATAVHTAHDWGDTAVEPCYASTSVYEVLVVHTFPSGPPEPQNKAKVFLWNQERGTTDLTSEGFGAYRIELPKEEDYDAPLAMIVKNGGPRVRQPSEAIVCFTINGKTPEESLTLQQGGRYAKYRVKEPGVPDRHQTDYKPPLDRCYQDAPDHPGCAVCERRNDRRYTAVTLVEEK